MKLPEEQLQGSVANCLCSAVPVPHPPSRGDPGSALKSPIWKPAFSMQLLEKLSTLLLAGVQVEEKVVERSGGWWAFSGTFQSPEQGWNEILRENSSLGQHREQKGTQRTGRVHKTHFIRERFPFFDDAVHGLDKSRVKSCPVQLGSCSQSLI